MPRLVIFTERINGGQGLFVDDKDKTCASLEENVRDDTVELPGPSRRPERTDSLHTHIDDWGAEIGLRGADT